MTQKKIELEQQMVKFREKNSKLLKDLDDLTQSLNQSLETKDKLELEFRETDQECDRLRQAEERISSMYEKIDSISQNTKRVKMKLVLALNLKFFHRKINGIFLRKAVKFFNLVKGPFTEVKVRKVHIERLIFSQVSKVKSCFHILKDLNYKNEFRDGVTYFKLKNSNEKNILKKKFFLRFKEAFYEKSKTRSYSLIKMLQLGSIREINLKKLIYGQLLKDKTKKYLMNRKTVKMNLFKSKGDVKNESLLKFLEAAEKINFNFDKQYTTFNQHIRVFYSLSLASKIKIERRRSIPLFSKKLVENSFEQKMKKLEILLEQKKMNSMSQFFSTARVLEYLKTKDKYTKEIKKLDSQVAQKTLKLDLEVKNAQEQRAVLKLVTLFKKKKKTEFHFFRYYSMCLTRMPEYDIRGGIDILKRIFWSSIHNNYGIFLTNLIRNQISDKQRNIDAERIIFNSNTKEIEIIHERRRIRKEIFAKKFCKFLNFLFKKKNDLLLVENFCEIKRFGFHRYNSRKSAFLWIRRNHLNINQEKLKKNFKKLKIINKGYHASKKLETILNSFRRGFLLSGLNKIKQAEHRKYNSLRSCTTLLRNLFKMKNDQNKFMVFFSLKRNVMFARNKEFEVSVAVKNEVESNHQHTISDLKKLENCIQERKFKSKKNFLEKFYFERKTEKLLKGVKKLKFNKGKIFLDYFESYVVLSHRLKKIEHRVKFTSFSSIKLSKMTKGVSNLQTGFNQDLKIHMKLKEEVTEIYENFSKNFKEYRQFRDSLKTKHESLTKNLEKMGSMLNIKRIHNNKTASFLYLKRAVSRKKKIVKKFRKNKLGKILRGWKEILKTNYLVSKVEMIEEMILNKRKNLIKNSFSKILKNSFRAKLDILTEGYILMAKSFNKNSSMYKKSSEFKQRELDLKTKTESNQKIFLHWKNYFLDQKSKRKKNWLISQKFYQNRILIKIFFALKSNSIKPEKELSPCDFRFNAPFIEKYSYCMPNVEVKYKKYMRLIIFKAKTNMRGKLIKAFHLLRQNGKIEGLKNLTFFNRVFQGLFIKRVKGHGRALFERLDTYAFSYSNSLRILNFLKIRKKEKREKLFWIWKSMAVAKKRSNVHFVSEKLLLEKLKFQNLKNKKFNKNTIIPVKELKNINRVKKLTTLRKCFKGLKKNKKIMKFIKSRLKWKSAAFRKLKIATRDNLYLLSLESSETLISDLKEVNKLNSNLTTFQSSLKEYINIDHNERRKKLDLILKGSVLALTKVVENLIKKRKKTGFKGVANFNDKPIENIFDGRIALRAISNENNKCEWEKKRLKKQMVDIQNQIRSNSRCFEDIQK